MNFKNHAKRNLDKGDPLNIENDNSNRSGKFSGRRKPVLITGGAGFIGTNLAHRLLSEGQPVLLYDNLSRPGVEHNLEWLQKTHGNLVDVEVADIQDASKISSVVKHASKVFHLAAQVAVTTSLTDPIHDFEVNARGTLNLLEGLRALVNPPPILFTSTNKVYGDLHDVELRMRNGRYEPSDPKLCSHGFNESRPLDFHSPYGCSKGCACEYVLDYSRTFRIPAVAFHMSCIYGFHQFGNEDQGWVAHFLIQALQNKPITIYGDGRQVRDILFVEDLIDAFLLAHEKIHTLSGQSFNIGGSPANTISLLELLDIVAELQGAKTNAHFKEWRSADQRYYVSDIRKFSAATGWKPMVEAREGITRLYRWLQENHPLFSGRPDGINRLNGSRNGNSRAHHEVVNRFNGSVHKRQGRVGRFHLSNGATRKCAQNKLAKAL
jgi:CDP-paratose 2-epimerase